MGVKKSHVRFSGDEAAAATTASLLEYFLVCFYFVAFLSLRAFYPMFGFILWIILSWRAHPRYTWWLYYLLHCMELYEFVFFFFEWKLLRVLVIWVYSFNVLLFIYFGSCDSNNNDRVIWNKPYLTVVLIVTSKIDVYICFKKQWKNPEMQYILHLYDHFCWMKKKIYVHLGYMPFKEEILIFMIYFPLQLHEEFMLCRLCIIYYTFNRFVNIFSNQSSLSFRTRGSYANIMNSYVCHRGLLVIDNNVMFVLTSW